MKTILAMLLIAMAALTVWALAERAQVDQDQEYISYCEAERCYKALAERDRGWE